MHGDNSTRSSCTWLEAAGLRVMRQRNTTDLVSSSPVAIVRRKQTGEAAASQRVKTRMPPSSRPASLSCTLPLSKLQAIGKSDVNAVVRMDFGGVLGGAQ